MKGYGLIILNLISAYSYAEVTTHSNINLPLKINLAAMENQINESLPFRLETIDMKDQTCVEARWLKTKGIPKCSMEGIKIYCKDSWIKTKTTPSISCDVAGSIDRNGSIALTGQGRALNVTIPLKASITARGRGDIGKHIQQTVRAEAEITTALTPFIDENWNVKVEVGSNYQWTKRPAINLFNLIPITISSHVDPVLKKELENLKKILPKVIDEAKIKDKVENAWNTLQQPQLIDKNTNTYFLFEPRGVGFSQINVLNNILHASFNINGYPKIIVGTEIPVIDLKPLPKLESINNHEPEIYVNLPIKIDYKQIEDQANVFINDLNPIDLDEYGYKGLLEISNIKLRKNGDKLRLNIDLKLTKSKSWVRKLDFFGWFDVKGTATFNLKPEIDSERNIIYMTDFSMDSSTDNILADILVDLANLKPIRSIIEKNLSYNFSKEVTSAEKQLNQALNSKLLKDISLSGNVTSVSIHKVDIKETQLVIPTQLIAAATLNVGL